MNPNFRYPDYLRMLAGRFNPEAAGNIMCRTLISYCCTAGEGSSCIGALVP